MMRKPTNKFTPTASKSPTKATDLTNTKEEASKKLGMIAIVQQQAALALQLYENEAKRRH